MSRQNRFKFFPFPDDELYKNANAAYKELAVLISIWEGPNAKYPANFSKNLLVEKAHAASKIADSISARLFTDEGDFIGTKNFAYRRLNALRADIDNIAEKYIK